VIKVLKILSVGNSTHKYFKIYGPLNPLDNFAVPLEKIELFKRLNAGVDKQESVLLYIISKCLLLNNDLIGIFRNHFEINSFQTTIFYPFLK